MRSLYFIYKKGYSDDGAVRDIVLSQSFLVGLDDDYIISCDKGYILSYYI